ncbi:MAG: hypothetical protein DWQ35_22265 [Planctomycetota bacterium]|nr:MAG: hypothetical protein DWQ35_22265 [Planctomycetota bacterium]
MKRRTFLIATGLLGGGAGLATLIVTRGGRDASRQRIVDAARTLAADPEVRAVGRACLDGPMAGLDEDALIEEIAGALPAVEPQTTPDRTMAALLERIQADFEQEATVSAAGWVLSGTEARLCALAALLEPVR